MEAVGREYPTSGLHKTDFCIMTARHGTRIHIFSSAYPKKNGAGIWLLYFSILVFMAYYGSQR